MLTVIISRPVREATPQWAGKSMYGVCSLQYVFNAEAKDSRMFKNFPEDVMTSLATEPITLHSHKYSITVKVWGEMMHYLNNTPLYSLVARYNILIFFPFRVFMVMRF